MRVSREMAAMLLATLVSLALAPASASAQNAPAQNSARPRAQQPAARTAVAVIDIAYIFRNHEGIKQQVEQVEQTMKSYEADLMAKRDELKQLAEQIKQYKVGSAEYSRTEETLASKESSLRLEATRKRKELADAEAKIYYENYQRISAIVEQIAYYNSIDLVLRYNSEEMELGKADSVLRGVTKDVVYHAKQLDLTPMVMQALGQQLGTKRVASPSPAPTNR